MIDIVSVKKERLAASFQTLSVYVQVNLMAGFCHFQSLLVRLSARKSSLAIQSKLGYSVFTFVHKNCINMNLWIYYSRETWQMILEITFNNYRLFKGLNSLSFSADMRTKKLLSNTTKLDEKNVLKCVGLYGENNGGKTNVVNLLEILRCLLNGEVKGMINRPLFKDSPLSEFSITFNNGDGQGWLKYELSFDSQNLSLPTEKLSSIKFYENGAPFFKVIFEKDVENGRLTFFDADRSEYLDVLPSTRPFLYSVKTDEGLFSPLKAYLQSLQCLASSIEVIRMYNIPLRKTMEALKGNDKKQKDFIRSFVKSADLTIEDFSYEKKPMLSSEGENDLIAEDALAKYVELQDAFRLSTTYQGVKVPSLFFDSSGTKKIEALAAYVYEAISKGKFLVIDELDNGLHFNLTRAIVSAFNNLGNKKGQLFFTSHDLLLIDCKSLLRKDQICFSVRENGKAKLFCLKEAKIADGGPREGSDLLRYYQRGGFGKVPMPSFVKEIISIGDGKRGDE